MVQRRKLHREDGPAATYPDGAEFWYKNDKLHRFDGPAVTWGKDGSEEYWVNGVKMNSKTKLEEENEMNIFEEASRKALRFGSCRGNITIEDLWTMPLSDNGGFCLDEIAKAVNRDVLKNEETSFVKKSSKPTVHKLKLDIVKHIIKTKIEEAEKAAMQKTKKAKQQTILEILERKKMTDMENMTEEDLKKLLEEI